MSARTETNPMEAKTLRIIVRVLGAVSFGIGCGLAGLGSGATAALVIGVMLLSASQR